MAEIFEKSESKFPWWKKFIEHATAKIPTFRFMVHDQWANVLFLHWRVPEHLESTLEANTDPFIIEKYDGSAWIGLILLTEENVGPSIGRSRWTCLTHHGINVRTYVQGSDCSGSGESPSTRGIHFSSLECDDEFTSFGANFFGMPYRVATMKRSYWSSGSTAQEAGEETNKSTSSARRYHYMIRSERLSAANPSLARILFHSLNWWRPRLLHSTEIAAAEDSPSGSFPKATGFKLCATSSPSQQFTVDCSWSRVYSNNNDSGVTGAPADSAPPLPMKKEEESFEEWATERYFVYTHKYGQNWRGKVDHEPWPREPSTAVQLDNLSISGVDAYEPKSMRPILRYMSEHSPNKVGFSQGVGPVYFTMLQPVR